MANGMGSRAMNHDCEEITRLEDAAWSNDPIETAQARTALTALLNQIRTDRDRMEALHRDCPDLAVSNDVPRDNRSNPIFTVTRVVASREATTRAPGRPAWKSFRMCGLL